MLAPAEQLGIAACILMFAMNLALVANNIGRHICNHNHNINRITLRLFTIYREHFSWEISGRDVVLDAFPPFTRLVRYVVRNRNERVAKWLYGSMPSMPRRDSNR